MKTAILLSALSLSACSMPLFEQEDDHSHPCQAVGDRPTPETEHCWHCCALKRSLTDTCVVRSEDPRCYANPKMPVNGAPSICCPVLPS